MELVFPPVSCASQSQHDRPLLYDTSSMAVVKRDTRNALLAFKVGAHTPRMFDTMRKFREVFHQLVCQNQLTAALEWALLLKSTMAPIPETWVRRIVYQTLRLRDGAEQIRVAKKLVQEKLCDQTVLMKENRCKFEAPDWDPVHRV